MLANGPKEDLSNQATKEYHLSFEAFQFDPRIAATVRAEGYTTPTPIQEKAIPPVLQGRDLVGLANTGTGKTAVFALPILQRLLGRQPGLIRALILAPTRELAEQIHTAFCAFGRKTKLRSTAIYGGVGINPQKARLKAGTDVVIACPGRLLDLIGQGAIDLSALEVLVLDEADRMLDMGFLPDIRRILRHLPKERQTLQFSATMPEEIRILSREILRNPITVQVGHQAPVETVTHFFYPVEPHLKTQLLMELLRKTDTESVLVFVRTKHRAQRLGDQLQKTGFKATSLQGNLPQSKRQAALEGFRRGSVQILVATDIAARGLDISLISHVINYDIPDSADAYTHRIGRTGRAAKTGDAFTFIGRDDAAMVSTIERAVGAKIERRRLETFNYNEPAPVPSFGSKSMYVFPVSDAGSKNGRGPLGRSSWNNKVKRGLPRPTRNRYAVSRG